MKLILYLSLLACSSLLFATKEESTLDKIKAHYPNTKVLSRIDNVICRAKDSAVYHDEDANFFVQQGKSIYSLEKAFVGKELREIPKSALAAYLAQSYLTLNQVGDGEFSLDSNGRLPGGGAFGAAFGVLFGKASVSVVGHGLIYLVTLPAGPAQLPAAWALESIFGPTIETASMHAAVCMGLFFGVASGPV